MSQTEFEFSDATWSADTRITLANVPWDNTYRDIVHDTAFNIDTYINSRPADTLDFQKVQYAKVDAPIKLNVPINALNKYNYLRASNGIQPVPGDVQQSYYYFIVGIRSINPNTTELTLQLDIWQTFRKRVRFGNCYIERGHIGIANEKAFDNYGRDYLTQAEGIDIGGEYVIKSKRSETIMSLIGENEDFSHDILVASTVDLAADPGTLAAPKLVAAKGSLFSGLPSGASYYVFRGVSSFKAFMARMSAAPWVTQGIISITVIPPVTRYIPTFGWGTGDYTAAPESSPPAKIHALAPDWRENLLNNLIPARYRHLTKFLTYPYLAIELTTFTGTPIIIKPEAWNDPDATVVERVCLVPPNQRVTVTPSNYNANTPSNVYNGSEDNGEYIDFATLIGSFPTMALVNNAAIGYMASNMNNIAFQNQSADWSQQKALRGSEVSYDQAASGMNLANTLTGIGIGSDNAQTAQGLQTAGYQAIAGAASAVIGGIGGGPAGIASGIGSAAMSGVNYAIQANQATAALGIRNSTASASNNASVGNTGYIADTNYNLAQYAARGDYENSIAGINAKIQDVKLTQPTTTGQVGGEAMNLIHNNMRISLRFKTIDGAAMRAVGEYWLRYGYAVRQFGVLPETLHTMSKFTYWKLSETYLASGAMTESQKQTIRGIFEKGVTVWRNPNEIGMVDLAANKPLKGITL